MRFINFDYLETPNLDFHKIINKAPNKAKFDKDEPVNAKVFGADTGYLGNNWTENLNGEGYYEAGGLAGRPDLQRKIRDIVAQLAPRVSAVEDEFSNRYGWNRNTALNRLYEPEAQVSSPSGLLEVVTAEPPAGSKSTRPVNEQIGINQIFFRDQYDEYLARTAPTGNPEARGELLRGANDPQPNNGGSAREELSKLVPDGVGQAARASPQEDIKSPSKTSRPVNEQLGITQIFFRDQYDDYLRESAPVNNPEGRGEFAPSSNGSQPNRGREGQAELSKLVRDGLGQAAGQRGREVVGRFEILQK